MSLADDFRGLAAVIEAVEATADGLDVADARPLGHHEEGVRAQLVIDADAAVVQDLLGGDAPGSYLPAETVDADDVEDGPEDDQDDGADNPYAPADYGTLTVSEDTSGLRVNIPDRVLDQFDTGRYHIRQHHGRIELVPGASDDWPDYSTGTGRVSTPRVIKDMLDVVAGDEVHAEPDGDVVVLEPRRIAERPEPEDQSTLDDICERLTDGAAAVLRTLDERGEVGSSTLQDATHLSHQGVHSSLNTLREESLVTSRADPDDGRRKLYSLADDIGTGDEEDAGEWDTTCDECGAEFANPSTLQKHRRNTVCGGLPEHVDEDDYAEIVAEADTVLDVQEAFRCSRERTRTLLADRGDLEQLDAKSPQERIEQVDLAQDGGAVASSDTAASAVCQNCDSQVTARYARVFTPEDEDNPRMCPNCEDKVRETDGTVRDNRNKGGGD